MMSFTRLWGRFMVNDWRHVCRRLPQYNTGEVVAPDQNNQSVVDQFSKQAVYLQNFPAMRKQRDAPDYGQNRRHMTFSTRRVRAGRRCLPCAARSAGNEVSIDPAMIERARIAQQNFWETCPGKSATSVGCRSRRFVRRDPVAV
jgi:hypothetical protein